VNGATVIINGPRWVHDLIDAAVFVVVLLVCTSPFVLLWGQGGRRRR
jgi:hypothetical protein